MISSALRVARSVGELNSVAVARQWMQRRLQPLVTSQKTSRALFSPASWCGCLPLSSTEVMPRLLQRIDACYSTGVTPRVTIEKHEHSGRDTSHDHL